MLGKIYRWRNYISNYIFNENGLLRTKRWEKYRNFTKFPGVEILWKANFPKLCGNCFFPQNFGTRKLGEITVFFAVKLEKNNARIPK